MIEQRRGQHPVNLMCRATGLSRSGYYAWRQRPASPRTIANRRLLVEIGAIHQERSQTYGSPRMHFELQGKGIQCSLNRVARLMRQKGFKAIRPRRKRSSMNDPARECPIAPNRLNRDFAVGQPDRVWLGDITEIETGEGVSYLGVVMDLYSRMIVGWAMAEHKDKQLTYQALDMALGRRRPPAALLHHTDQGSQYSATIYHELLRRHGIVPSMSRKGNPYDNAPMESWIRTLKVECVYRLDRTVRREVKEAIAEYIELNYNSRRRHSALGYLSPAEFERQNGVA